MKLTLKDRIFILTKNLYLFSLLLISLCFIEYCIGSQAKKTEDVRPLLEKTLKEGELYGEEKTYYSNGNLYAEGTFKEGTLIRGKKYHYTGYLQYEGTFKEGGLVQGKTYHDNGNLESEGTYKEGDTLYLKLEGKGKTYHDNGNLSREGIFKAGELVQGKTYHRNGNLESEGTFREDELVGKGKTYHDNGNLSAEGTFKKYGLEGKGKTYHLNGYLQYEGTFKEGRLVGKGKEYYDNGKLKYAGTFYQGIDTYDTGVYYSENGEKEFYNNGRAKEEKRLQGIESKQKSSYSSNNYAACAGYNDRRSCGTYCLSAHSLGSDEFKDCSKSCTKCQY